MHLRVWAVLDEDVTSSELLARYAALLSPAERTAEDRFVFEADRRRHRVTRALVRTVLSEVAPGIAPRDWSFLLNPHGRPEIHPRHGLPELRFNLSHTAGAIVLAVTDALAIGIDVENHLRAGPTTDVAHQFFSSAEVVALRALPASAQRERFFVLWTLKEAYVKARGLGLALPLDAFSFAIDGGAVALRCDPSCDDDPARWSCAVFALTPVHTMAVAVQPDADDRLPLDVEVLRTVPLLGKTVMRCPPKLVDRLAVSVTR